MAPSSYYLFFYEGKTGTTLLGSYNYTESDGTTLQTALNGAGLSSLSNKNWFRKMGDGVEDEAVTLSTNVSRTGYDGNYYYTEPTPAPVTGKEYRAVKIMHNGNAYEFKAEGGKIPEITADILVIGGGGGGSGGDGGGGGAGGFVAWNNIVLSGDQTVFVGLGGKGGYVPCKGSQCMDLSGTNGGNSGIGCIVAFGGGHGGSGGGGYTKLVNGGCGGSGGGGGANYGNFRALEGCPYDSTQGYKGGACVGGGGGAGGAGVSCGNGGAGKQSSISGTACYYSGGGGGGYRSGNTSGGTGGGGCGGSCTGTLYAGDATFFGGGGGGLFASCTCMFITCPNLKGGDGYQGIVYVRYPKACNYVVSGGTKYECGDYCIHRFLGPDTLEIIDGPHFDYIGVGGGGAGVAFNSSGSSNRCRGGGGAGGEVKVGSYRVNVGDSICIAIGSGGSNQNCCYYGNGCNGGNTKIGNVVIRGGCGGVADDGGNNFYGLWGGKGACYTCGGGGGAGAFRSGAANNTCGAGGHGGPGLCGYGGGGTGGGSSPAATATDGGGKTGSTPNATNYGGGGAGGNISYCPGAGYRGIVKICYKTDGSQGIKTATGGTITTSGEYTIHTFTSNGTFTVTS